MKFKENLGTLGIVLTFLFIAVNILLLYKLKQNSISELPFNHLNIKKPTLVVIFDEFECASCVHGLRFLNDLYTTIKSEARLEFMGLILSKNRTDSKNISKAFVFPCVVTNNFKILKRLNLNQTPVIIGISKDHRIVYSDLIPIQTEITENYIKKGVLDRLYYSSNQ
jgi:hypothetical protein